MRWAVALFKGFLVDCIGQAAIAKQLHIGRVQVVGNHADRACFPGFGNCAASALLAVGGDINACKAGIPFQNVLGNFISEVFPVKAGLEGKQLDIVCVPCTQRVKKAVQAVVVGGIVEVACEREDLPAGRNWRMR